MTDLRYEVLVVDGVERQRDLKMPDGGPIISSPCASTLIIGDEKAQWWERAVAAYPPYADYQAKTERQIPVFIASRR